MKMKNWMVAAALTALGLSAGTLISQEGQPGPELMQQMMEAAQPGEEHELLKSLEGEWEQTYLMTMMPGAPEMEYQGTTRNRMILGGRFLEQRAEGTMGPQTVQNLSVTGFDRRHGRFTTVGFDNLGTYSVSAEGQRDPDTGLIVMKGEDQDLLGKQIYRFELDIRSANEYVTSIIFTQLGPNTFEDGFKMVEIISRRKK